MNAKRRIFLLVQKVLDIGREFGKDSTNALAVILSHELAHFYRKPPIHMLQLGEYRLLNRPTPSISQKPVVRVNLRDKAYLTRLCLF